MTVDELRDKLHALSQEGHGSKEISTNYHYHGEVYSVGLTPNYAVSHTQQDPLNPTAEIVSFALIGLDELTDEQRPAL